MYRLGREVRQLRGKICQWEEEDERSRKIMKEREESSRRKMREMEEIQNKVNQERRT